MASTDFASKLLEYFLQPKASGYDAQKTLTLALVLVAAAYAVYRLLRRLGVRIDVRLAVAVAPYVVLGSVVRVLEDAALLPDSFLFVTPMIYVLIFGITFTVLLASLLGQKRFGVPYHKTTFLAGVLMLPFALSQLPAADLQAAAMVAVFFAPWALLFRLAKWIPENKAVALLHMFDATSTAVAMQFFGYYEQHVLPTAVIGAFGPFSFVLLKLVAVVAIVVAIDRFAGNDAESKEFARYLKLVIGILGAATGTRDFITLLAGV
jgi:uncharacterized membrane protein